MCSSNPKVHFAEASAYSNEELLRDHAFFAQPFTSTTGPESDPTSLKAKVTELESEVEKLREQLGKAKGVNDAMWDTVVERLINQAKETEGNSRTRSEDLEELDRRRKRGRAT
jgi:pre-rRNA-processing protein IPI3